ncbi:MAG: AMP-binding protein [Gammaproteobacteria bacterium]|nr:AMP-binding protein [Gammaproteobacteria bacterium]MBT4492251.1 AMP-binding protein [Gammaproteobacteria bacterium]MBT7370570.1 AMP-binding protein [Gammaproteobacteria bacterium]
MSWQDIIQAEVYDPLEQAFPDRNRSMAEAFLSAVETHGNKVAIVYEGREITFRQMGDDVLKAAHVLRHELGVEQGDRVAILLGTEPAFGVAAWAAVCIGAIVCPMNIRYQQQELKYQLALTEPRVVLTDPELVGRILPLMGELPSLEHIVATTGQPEGDVLPFSRLTEGTLPDEIPFRFVDETEPAFIFFTAGTTGHPKGAVNSHRSLLYSYLRGRAESRGAGSEQVLCIPIPLNYTGGCKSFLGGFCGGTRSIFLKTWKIDDLLETVQEHRVTNLFALGSIWALLIASPNFSKYDLSSIPMVFFGGSSTPTAVMKRIAEALPHTGQVQGYGMTECNSGTVELDALVRPDSCGLPHPGTQIRIVDDEERKLSQNQVGQILIRNPQLFSGYWKDPVATEEVMKGGWYHTGDMGYLDDEGRLYISGREKDMIIRGQENIYPAEVETVINQHPAVSEVAVIGVPDEIFGEQVMAIMVPRDGQVIETEEVKRLCEENLAEFKVPRFMRVRDEPLPRNPGGKILKRELI